MSRYNLLKNESLNSILQYVFIFLTIILSRDTLITSVKLGFYKSYILYLIIMFILLLLFIISNRLNINVKEKAAWSIGTFIILIIIISLIKLDFQFYILSIIMYILTSYFFIYIFTFEDFFRKFSNIMIIIGIFSFITCYALRPILFINGTINNKIPIITNSVGLNFFDFGLSYVVALPYYIRNFGVFREPGVYQYFLMIPLIYELLLEKKKIRYFNISILSITIISTFSLSGIILMSIVYIIYILKLIYDKKFTKKTGFIFFISIFILFLILTNLYFINNNFSTIINESIKKLFTVNDSTSSRLESTINNIKYFLYSPLWGNKFSSVQYASKHNTDSVSSIFSMFGMFTGLLYIWLQYLFAKRVSNSKVIRIMTLIVLLLAISSEFLMGNTNFWIILFSIFMIREDENNDVELWDIRGVFKRLHLNFRTIINWIFS